MINSKRKLLVIIFVFAATVLPGISAAPKTASASSRKPYYIKINRQQNCVTVYEKNKKGKYTVPVKAMACSVGLNYRTPRGVFTLSQKYRWHKLNGMVYGQYCSRITGHVLFHSVYYSTTNPSRLNYGEYNKLGSAASHGCIRLCVADAKWIYDNCASGTKVEIYDGKVSGPLGKPKPIRIDTSNTYRSWDPTDPNKSNPWRKLKPTLTGAKNKTLNQGTAKSKLTAGVKAADYRKKALKVRISGKYNLKKPGKYKVTYNATDYLKNTTTKTVTLTIKDTRKPSVKILKQKAVLKDTDSSFSDSDELADYLKQYVAATDDGEKLSAKNIYVETDALWDAWQKKLYGTYKLKVYAKDRAGHVSEKRVLTVSYSV